MNKFTDTFTREQKAGIIRFCLGIANVEDPEDDKEMQYVSSTATLLGIKMDDAAIQKSLSQNIGVMISNLKQLSPVQKEWIVVAILAQLKINGRISDVKTKYASKILQYIGITEDIMEKVKVFHKKPGSNTAIRTPEVNEDISRGVPKFEYPNSVKTPAEHTNEKKVKIVYTDAFVKQVNGKLVYKNNYVVISGDVDTFIADKKATHFYCVMEDGEFKGKPRITLPYTSDRYTEMERFLNKDGIYVWSVDKTGKAIEDALFAELPASVQLQEGLRMIAVNKLKKEQLLADFKAQRELNILANEKRYLNQKKADAKPDFDRDNNSNRLNQTQPIEEQEEHKKKKPSNIKTMGLFDSINTNNSKWLKAQSSNATPQHLKKIINDFYIPDNIIVEKVMENQRADKTIDMFGGLENWELLNQLATPPEAPINCTPTFREHYSSRLDPRGSHIPKWFYIGYPDVAFWFQINTNKIAEELNFDSRADQLMGEYEFQPLLFREIINYYKIINGKLECA